MDILPSSASFFILLPFPTLCWRFAFGGSSERSIGGLALMQWCCSQNYQSSMDIWVFAVLCCLFVAVEVWVIHITVYCLLLLHS